MTGACPLFLSGVSMEWMKLRGRLPDTVQVIVSLVGAAAFLLAWHAFVSVTHMKPSILPSPVRVLTCLPDLMERHLVENFLFSIQINLLGYAESVAISLVLGFIIGLNPTVRALCERPLTAFRYLPLTALIGVFMVWFGIATNMKVQFLTIGIVVYLLPVVVQRIDEVQQVYVDTVRTLGATDWQTIWSVFIPDVISRLSDDIRVLVPISWTYIIIVECLNMTQGGIGAMAYKAARMSRVDQVFAIVILVLIFGWLQDQIWLRLDRVIFRHKYA